MIRRPPRSSLFFSPALFVFCFNDTATTEIYTLSLHDALPISVEQFLHAGRAARLALALPPILLGAAIAGASYSRWRSNEDAIAQGRALVPSKMPALVAIARSEEHTSELQSHSDLVCRLLLAKK